MNILIRGATAADAAEIADVHLISRRARMPYLPDLHSAADVRTYFATSVLPSSTVLVATSGERIIGFAAVSGDSLDHLYVRPEHLRTGVGSRLLEQVKLVSPKGLRLYVFQRNHQARAFYRRHGFVVSSFASGQDNEEKEPDLVMSWTPDGELRRSAT